MDETLRRFSESVKNPKELAQAQETLADTAEHVMDSMIIEDRHTGSIDIRQMKLLCSQLRIASNMSRQENYIVPIETADGVTGMKLRIVRGEDKKGLVDIFLEDKKCGRVAAFFEAKENSVSAMIVTDDEQTKKLFEDNITMFEAGISDGEQRVRIDVALEHDISAKESKMSDNETKKQLDGSESVQTTRLYHIAEQFIVNVQGCLRKIVCNTDIYSMRQVILIVFVSKKKCLSRITQESTFYDYGRGCGFLSIKYSLLGLMLRGFATQREVFKAPRIEDASSFPASEAS